MASASDTPPDNLKQLPNNAGKKRTIGNDIQHKEIPFGLLGDRQGSSLGVFHLGVFQEEVSRSRCHYQSVRILGCRRCYLRHGFGPLHTQRRARKAPLDSTYRNLGSREGRSPISRVLSPESRTFGNVIREPWHLRTTSNSYILNWPSYLSLLQEFGNDRGLVSMDLRVLPEGKPVLTLIV